VDKLTEGQWIFGKLNRLRSDREARSIWLDPWVEPEALVTLDATIKQFGEIWRILQRHAQDHLRQSSTRKFLVQGGTRTVGMLAKGGTTGCSRQD